MKKNILIDTSYKDFPSIALDSGIVIMKYDTIDIPGGVLISDRKAALYVFYKSGYEHNQKELKYTKYLLKEYYNKAKAVEGLYQKEILKLSKEKERNWLEKNMGYIGYIGGALSVILLFYAIK
jgi:hypothetical protein